MRHALAAFLVLLFPKLLAAAPLTPSSVEQFFLVPDQPAVLRWSADAKTASGPVSYQIRDYGGAVVGSGKTETTGVVVEMTVRLAQGFYELEFPAVGQSFGLLAMPAFQARRDPFFAIDSALSWLVRDDSIRRGMIRALARSGIGMSRERQSWSQVNPAAGKWSWEAPARYDTVRKFYAETGVEVLEMFHDAPAWLGRVGKYPADLAGTSRAWCEQIRHGQRTWGALEVWNEPDIDFGGLLPGDQYVPVVDALSWAFAREQVRRPLVGGVFATFNRQFLDSVARNGMLDRVDVVSFHTYGQAIQMESLVAKYRGWLQAAGRGPMPLWITECGRPWKRGPQRPPQDQDSASALDITMKGVEARACGIARYFPFVLPYYEEHANNFGMMDRHGSPMRSLAAYAQLVRTLAGKDYLGDLPCDDPAVRLARAFGDAQSAVLVLYTQKPRAAVVKLPVTAQRVEGIDGRPLAIHEGKVPMPDGLCYVWLDRQSLAGRLKTDTPAMRLLTLSRQAMPRRPAPSPIVLRFQLDSALLDARPEGYLVKNAKTLSRLPLQVQVFNLDKQPQEIAVRLTLPEGSSLVEGAPTQKVSLGAEASTNVAWTADVHGASGALEPVHLGVTAEGAKVPPIAPRELALAAEPDLPEILKRCPKATALPIRDLTRWQGAIARKGQMSMANSPETAWTLRCTFAEGDRWVYPQFRLPEGLDLSRFAAMVVRARCHRPGTVRVFLWEGDRGVGYITPSGIVPADGQWHVAVIRFSDLMLSSANAPDPNDKLDLDQVRRLSIGMNSQSAENVLDTSDVYLLER